MALNFSKMNFSVSFNPTSAFPLDARSYFESYEEALAAAALAVEAGSSEGVLHFGQTITVVENNIAQLFIIQPDGSLGEIGGKITIDPNVFALNTDGSLNLLGFAAATAGAQLTKSADGKITWVKPDTTTVDGLNIAITTLQDKVSTLETTIGNEQEGLIKDVANLQISATDFDTDIKELQSKVGLPKDGENAATGIYAELDKKANAADVLTKIETEIAINSAINQIDHLKRKIVNSLDEVEAYLNEDDALHYIYMVPTDFASVAVDDKYDEYIIIESNEGTRTIEKVGSWEVDLSGYVKTETLDNYALKTEVTNLSNTVSGLSDIVAENKNTTDAAIVQEKERAEAAEKANADAIAALTPIVNATKSTAEQALEKAETAQSGVDQINITIDGRLLTDDDRTKLDKLVVNGDEVGISGTINASNVKELDTWLENNGETYIVNLGEKNLSNDLVTKINFITSVNTEEFSVSEGKLNLKLVDGSKINLATNPDFTGVAILSETHSQKIAELESLKVNVQTNTTKLTNLEELTIPAIQAKFDNYVLNSVHINDIAEIKDILTWKEMNQ